MRPTLFVQDVQNVWLYEPDSNQDLRRSVERRLGVMNDAIAFFRSKGFPVIIGYTEDPESGLVSGSWSFGVPDSLDVQEGDFRVSKRNANAFANPELGDFLKRNGCDTFVIVGLSASGLASSPAPRRAAGLPCATA